MRLGLLIAAYNRPQYLKECLESVKAADLSQVKTILIVDDASFDTETLHLIEQFDVPGVELIKAFSKENRSIKGSLLFGFDILLNTCEVVTNLDSDAIITHDCFNKLLLLHDRFPFHLKTGFNCRTKNRNGSERHIVLEEGSGYNTKKSVGGISMMFEKITYLQVVKPALQKCLKSGGNWDHTACIGSFNGYDRPIICCVPSVVQHIGIESSMGHTSGGEPPDVADDFVDSRIHGSDVTEFKPKMIFQSATADAFDGKKVRDLWKENARWVDGKLNLPEVTLIAADCVNVDRLLKAIDKCCEGINFGAVKVLSSIPSNDKRVQTIRHLPTKGDYSDFCMKELSAFVDTKYMLVVQYDGYVLNPAAWKDEWLDYDYIGAPWNWYTDGMNVGNGGFSLRSKKLMDIVAADKNIIPINEQGVTVHREEDHCICRLYRKYLEAEYDINFAPIEIARQFSIEGWKSENKTWTNEFGFHGLGLTNIKPRLNV